MFGSSKEAEKALASIGKFIHKFNYTGPTQNPEIDAARHDDEAEAFEEIGEKAAKIAPEIMLKKLQAIEDTGGWVDRKKFHGGNSANCILFDALSAGCTEVEDKHTYFMATMLKPGRDRLLEAMADWFAGIYAIEIYEEWLKEIGND